MFGQQLCVYDDASAGLKKLADVVHSTAMVANVQYRFSPGMAGYFFSVTPPVRYLASSIKQEEITVTQILWPCCPQGKRRHVQLSCTAMATF